MSVVQMEKEKSSTGIQRDANLPEVVFITLRDRIFSGFYWPKQRLVENSLAEELGVKRFLIRDALKRLANEGLVFSQHYKGTFVSEISSDEVFQTYQVQAFLEGSAAYLATEYIQEEDIQNISTLVTKSGDLDLKNIEEWSKLNRKIHTTINKACGNDKLINLIRDNVKFMKYWFIVLTTQQEVSKRNQEHQQILRALKRKNPNEVRNAVEGHIIEAGRDVLNRLKSSWPDFSKKRVRLA